MTELSGDAVEFDVKELNAIADKAFKPGHYAIVVGCLLMIGISVVLVVKFWPILVHGGFSPPELIGPGLIWGMTVFLVVGGVAEIREKRQGAWNVKLGEDSIELEYPDGEREFSRLSDPLLSFTLFEYRETPARGIVFHGRVTQLTPNSYEAVLAAVEARGMVQGCAREGTFFLPRPLRPLVRNIHGPSSGGVQALTNSSRRFAR
jgi:hypothetical protein